MSQPPRSTTKMKILKTVEKQPPSNSTKRAMSSPMALPRKLWLLVGLGIGGIIFIIRNRRTIRCCNLDCRAFVQRLVLRAHGPIGSAVDHPLKDLTFAIRDSFDVEWYITGFGSPEWGLTHEPAIRSAHAVAALVQAGATCTGKTMMDEMGYSLEGVTNEQYGRPVNPVSNSRIVGGSSCGSAVAVAANLVEFSLGIDTVGDVRLPAACCGVIGLRSSHGSVSCVGNIPTSGSLDAVGWFAKDPQILRKVGLVLLQLPLNEEIKPPRRIYVADDCYKPSTFLIEHSLDLFLRAVNKVYGRQILHHMDLGAYLTQNVPTLRAFNHDEQISAHPGIGEGISLTRDCMLMIYRDEFIKNHHDWMDKTKPKFGKGIHGRVRATYELTTSMHLVPTAKRVREEVRTAMNVLLKHESLLVLPMIPALPPKLNSHERARDRFQADTSLLMCIASMAGCPAASIPTGDFDGAPVALQLLSKPSGDRLLLDTIVALYPAIQEDSKHFRTVLI